MPVKQKFDIFEKKYMIFLWFWWKFSLILDDFFLLPGAMSWSISWNGSGSGGHYETDPDGSGSDTLIYYLLFTIIDNNKLGGAMDFVS